ncbi:MAG: hypothetical protein CME67_00180 [Halobacteriovoraceae bacterium]|nr:hypothetical protein [Halobacteriovoraceae bacterium]|tara:strand:+ start:2092 stop:2370 length:279 start_codon:yes stop_codon:yes gene_type:complete
MKITPENWTFCSFSHEELKAIITFGASPDILDDSFVYYVTVLDQDNNEVYQKEFFSIEMACDHINAKYSNIWEITDATRPTKSGGCSTCIAH